MTRAGVDLLVREIPYCSHRTANCWAGDRRLGACLIDAGVRFVRGKLTEHYWQTRDTNQVYDEYNKPGGDPMTTLHHIKGPENVVLTGLEMLFGADGMSGFELSQWLDILGAARTPKKEGPPPLKRNRWIPDGAR